MADLFSDCLGADAGVVAIAEAMMTEKQWEEPRLPKEKIAELALGIFSGEIFMDGQIREHDLNLLPVIFMGLTMISDERMQEFTAHPPAMLCASMKDTFPRSINGYPIFHTFQMIYQQDKELIRERVMKLGAAAKEILEQQREGENNAF